MARLFLVININDKVIQFTIISVSTEKHIIVYVTFAMMMKKFFPPVGPICPLPKALKGQIVS